ncbi:SGNH/GDSL hydrolase family protein [Ferdinandcohnia sp. Marseille-Q9671]
MKKALVIIVILLSVAIVVTGKLHWNNKIQSTAKTNLVTKTDDVKIKTVVEENKEDKVIKVKAYANNLPEEIQTKLISATEDGNPVHFVIAGSSATSEEPNAWPTYLKEKLETTYGRDVLQITIKEIADKTSNQVLQEELYQEIIDLSPDILLFEPFILYDNGKVRLETRLENLTEIINKIKVGYPEVSILLQPANPLHNAIHYPNEVDKLETYALENNYTYLNHWESWPDHQSDAIAPYLIDGVPSEQGHRVWFQYLVKYFIAE